MKWILTRYLEITPIGSRRLSLIQNEDGSIILRYAEFDVRQQPVCEYIIENFGLDIISVFSSHVFGYELMHDEDGGYGYHEWGDAANNPYQISWLPDNIKKQIVGVIEDMHNIEEIHDGDR